MPTSYVHGAGGRKLLGITIGQALAETSTAHPDDLALHDAENAVSLTWRALSQRVDSFARGLLALDLNPGERLGIWSFNCAEWTVAQLAAARAGLVLVTLNPSYRSIELSYALQTVGCACIIVGQAFKDSDYPAMVEQVLGDNGVPSIRHVIQIGTMPRAGGRSFEAVEELGREADPQRLSEVEERIDPDDPVNIQFTSGTTGRPKGVTLTHHNILNNAFFTGEGFGLTHGDRLCIPVPLYHCFGMVMGNLACIAHGAAMIYPGRGFDAAATLKVIADQHCTALYGVPTMFIALLQHAEFETTEVSSIVKGIMAGSPCPVRLMHDVRERFGMRDISICYGMTETSPVSFQTALDDSIERRVSTVGRVHPHLEAKIVDRDDQALPTETVGEVCVRGYATMRGYWQDSEQTNAVKDRAGWMHTGDLGVIDNEGYCQIVGRLKDMVIRGGENLYPREIEEFLHTHPSVQDVQVFGVPDKVYGEELAAWIIVREGHQLTEETVRAFCRENVARHKMPRYVRFVDSYPLTVTGKVQKFKLREAAERELGLAKVEGY